MRRIGAIIFLFAYLMANTELHQVLRLPILFAHYHEHRQANPQIGFADFMVLHYLRENVRDTDHERDRQLPFKDHARVVTTFPVAILPEDAPEPTPPACKPLINGATYKSPFTVSFILFTIWQPPRA